jgi:tetratricopeptide (TPR) repeat protein
MRLFIVLVLFVSVASAQDLQKGISLFNEKKLTEARLIFEKVDEDNKDYAAARFYLGRISYDEKNYEDAADFFEEAFEINDKVADYHYWYGSTIGTIAQDANTLRQGMLAPKIKTAFEKTIALDPQNIDAHWGLVEFYTQAPGFMGGDWEKAEQTAKGILKIKKSEGYRALATVFERQDKFVEAEKNFMLAYKEESLYIYNLSGFYIRRNDFDKAFALFENQLKKNPDDMLASYQIGKLAAISGKKLDDGEKYLLKYLSYQPKQNEPSHAGANMRLAQIKEKRGNKPEAKKLYEIALKMDGNLKEAKEGLARLK